MFFAELLRGYSTNQRFVCPRGVGGNYPQLPLVTQIPFRFFLSLPFFPVTARPRLALPPPSRDRPAQQIPAPPRCRTAALDGRSPPRRTAAPAGRSPPRRARAATLRRAAAQLPPAAVLSAPFSPAPVGKLVVMPFHAPLSSPSSLFVLLHPSPSPSSSSGLVAARFGRRATIRFHMIANQAVCLSSLIRPPPDLGAALPCS